MVQKTDLVQLRRGFRSVQAGAQLSNPLAQRFGVNACLLLLPVNGAGPDGNIYQSHTACHAERTMRTIRINAYATLITR